ncbi:5_t:CDS:2 [Ambispora gerdemannii]|uniref:5_t:CDS:1 n=1 Tax=Ambispora gerdemannii TaxID=144530 RepID=A0A9N9BRQ2_9GLOM|nr:5_t:CDS:2 [Ambispora gerdemannii]
MSDWYWIISETGYVLDVCCREKNPGTSVVLYTLNNQLRPFHQLWKIEDKYIVSKDTGFVLTLSTSPINDPTFVVKPRDSKDRGQLWNYDPNNLTLTSGLPFYVVTAIQNTANIVLCNPKALGVKHLENPVPKTQKWVFVKWSEMYHEE